MHTTNTFPSIQCAHPTHTPHTPHTQSHGACCSLDSTSTTIIALTVHGYVYGWQVQQQVPPLRVIGPLHVELPLRVRQGMQPVSVHVNSNASKVCLCVWGGGGTSVCGMSVCARW